MRAPKKPRRERRPRVLLVNRCFVRSRDGRFLIIKRAPTDANNAEKWECPGGKVEEGEDVAQALEKEVVEETGLMVNVASSLVYAASFMIGAGRYRGHNYLALFCVANVVGGTLTLSEEHTEYAWVTYEQMMAYDLTMEVRKAAIVFHANGIA